MSPLPPPKHVSEIRKGKKKPIDLLKDEMTFITIRLGKIEEQMENLKTKVYNLDIRMNESVPQLPCDWEERVKKLEEEMKWTIKVTSDDEKKIKALLKRVKDPIS